MHSPWFGDRQGAIVGAVPAWGLFRVLRALGERPGHILVNLRLDNGKGVDVTVGIGLYAGKIRCVTGERAPFTLSTHLLQSRAMPETLLDRYENQARNSGAPLCHVLAAERAIAPGELARQVESHGRAMIEALLPLAFSSWSARPHEPCGGACEMSGLDMVPLLMRTVARHPDLERMRAIVTRFLNGGEFHLTPGYEVYLTGARNQFQDARVLFLLRQGRNREVAQAVHAQERDLRVLFALIVAGAVEHGASRIVSAVGNEPPEDPVSRELRHTALDFRSKNLYEVLGLTIECRVSEVEEAARRLHRRYARARYEATATPRALEYLDEINARIDEAVQTLSDFARRTTYNHTLDSITPEVSSRLSGLFAARRTWQLGVSALKSGDVQEAVARFELAMQQDPEEPLYPVALAKALLSGPDAGRAGIRARELIEKVLERWPDFLEARVAMAHFLRGEGRRDEAMEHVRAVLRADPEHAEARRLKELLSAKSKPVPLNFEKKPESFVTRLKSRLLGKT